MNRRTPNRPPPVFIVVCNNTSVSKLVFDFIAGCEKPLTEDSTVLVPEELPIFSNVADGRWTSQPNTILIDSEQLESGIPDFIASRLNYVHQNPVRHGLVPVANQYRWCSAAWFERTATRAQVRTIYGFKIDRIKVVDDYDPL